MQIPRPPRLLAASPRRIAAGVATAILALLLLLAVVNNFAVRQRVRDSLARTLGARSGLRVSECRRAVVSTRFSCSVAARGASRPSISYLLEVDGRCWHATRVRPAPASDLVGPARVSGCLPLMDIAAGQ
jgi:hypothetical protein